MSDLTNNHSHNLSVVLDSFIEESCETNKEKEARLMASFEPLSAAEMLVKCIQSITFIDQVKGIAEARSLLGKLSSDGEVKEFIGNQRNGWTVYTYIIGGEIIVLSPQSGPDGSGQWFVKLAA